jgi:acyl-CoA hydrolase
VNSGGKGPNHYSGVGGAAMINRGLARGGVAYLCMKSMHTGLDGKRHSSVFPYLPEGTPISLTGPDIMGTREGAHFFLATEWGIARINALPQSEFIKAIISVAHPDEREELGKRAYEEFRVRL